jgi:two-component system, sensor histidine kinase and response regulator
VSDGGNVLIVDDRPDNLLALEESLRPLGVEVTRASSGADALRHLLVEDFAVILLDVQMPELDGFETARLIKSRARTAAIPIIFLTAINRELVHQLAGYGAGAVDYLAKPYEPEVLRSKVAVFVALDKQARVIADQNRMLAERLDDRARDQDALSRHAAELLRSNAALDRFASAVGHDILEPVHVLSGLLELIADRHAGELDEEGRKLVGRARARSMELAGHVEGLLNDSRDNGEPVRRDPTALGEVLDQARRELAEEIERTGTTVTSDPLPRVLGDQWQLVQVFVHLLDNAIRAGGPDPQVHVGLSRRRGEWVVSITDNGCGIGPDDQVRLFSPLPLDGDEGGLAISRRVVEHHGGTMTVDSVPDHGTTVAFTLPVAPETE